MSSKKILYGVCGIGSGHTQRQLPLIEHLAQQHQIVIFGYGESLRFYTERFRGHTNVSVTEVSVPFYVGNKDGIDYEATKNLPANQKDHDAINRVAKQFAAEQMDVPDLVISDYEPIAAEVAREHQVPLVSIDQQSKYLYGDFPTELGECGFKDEVERLMLFFPEAAERIACSFFRTEPKENGEKVLLVPPVLKPSVLEQKSQGQVSQDILVYLSAQQAFPQTYGEIESVCAAFPDYTFHIFTKETNTEQAAANVVPHKHGDSYFEELLHTCTGIISTAGHTLLSEAMHLQKPVYTLPLPVYEQQMNAYVIDTNDFGVSSDAIEPSALATFLQNLAQYRANIADDTEVLLKGDGSSVILDLLTKRFGL